MSTWGKGHPWPARMQAEYLPAANGAAMSAPIERAARAGAWLLAPVLLIALVVLFLYPYLFQGRVMLPLELMPIFQPWAKHAGELWGSAAPVHNPLLDA